MLRRRPRPSRFLSVMQMSELAIPETSVEDKLDISQNAISQRQVIIIEQLAELANQFSALMGFAQHIDGTLAALVESNNEIGTSQTDMQKTVMGMFEAAKNSPMAKMMFGKGGKSE